MARRTNKPLLLVGFTLFTLTSILLFVIIGTNIVYTSAAPQIEILSPKENTTVEYSNINFNGRIVNIGSSDQIRIKVIDEQPHLDSSEGKDITPLEGEIKFKRNGDVIEWSFTKMKLDVRLHRITIIVLDGEGNQLSSATVSFEIGGIHDPVMANTNSCSFCHSTHIASGNQLIGGQYGQQQTYSKSPGTKDDFKLCIQCHENEIGTYYGDKESGHYVTLEDGTSGHLSCSKCHKLHDPNFKLKEFTSSNDREFCISCHKDLSDLRNKEGEYIFPRDIADYGNGHDSGETIKSCSLCHGYGTNKYTSSAHAPKRPILEKPNPPSPTSSGQAEGTGLSNPDEKTAVTGENPVLEQPEATIETTKATKETVSDLSNSSN
ncbi:hypothetical protein A8F94_10635 [Bacillus sp. FJAT-27225]|uniref:cytochrome c3 family protein n=1 Tax=Bacillus sp. FJAT-27225 TaxID=1743144 RepID=UPI00080C2917|nr:cytochrome c3 family protein [Bacillus sp. FJAT-27225]OCA88247.1 hypothetical protein A8F94_10635 [Bacillus sp. FJAT-27225]